jgi:hypothetical protein
MKEVSSLFAGRLLLAPKRLAALMPVITLAFKLTSNQADL